MVAARGARALTEPGELRRWFPGELKVSHADPPHVLIGSWQGDGETFSVPLTALSADATGVVVLVQQRDQGPILGAASRVLR